jgi:glycosyltransferase involved in cell wall biosynthesis
MDKNKPLVCVCVPAYNAESTIAASLKSILAQTYRNLRVILVDNASTDRTVEICRELAAKDQRLEIFVSDVNIGGEKNYTRCIRMSAGDYTAIFHADDVYTETIVEREVEFLEANPEAGAVFTGAHEINSDGEVIGRRRFPVCLQVSDGRAYEFPELFRAVLKTTNFLIFPSAMVRTKIYKEEVLAWNPGKFRTSADLDVWLRIAERHRIGLLPEPLMKYRVSPDSYSYNFARLRTERQDLFLVLEEYLGKYSGSVFGEREKDDLRLRILKDDIDIAINRLIRGEAGPARKRLAGVTKFKNIAQSFRSLPQLKILVFGWLALFLSALPLTSGLRNLISRCRHKG